MESKSEVLSKDFFGRIENYLSQFQSSFYDWNVILIFPNKSKPNEKKIELA